MLTVLRAISYAKKCVAKTFSETQPNKSAIFRIPHIHFLHLNDLGSSVLLLCFRHFTLIFTGVVFAMMYKNENIDQNILLFVLVLCGVLLGKMKRFTEEEKQIFYFTHQTALSFFVLTCNGSSCDTGN